MVPLRILITAVLAVAGMAPTAVPAASQTACLPLGVDGRCPAWVSTEDGGDFDITTAVTTAPDGTAVYAAGTTVTPGGYRSLLVASDAAGGERRWAVTDGRDGDAYDTAYALAVSPDGGSVYIAGGACGAIDDGSTCDVLVAAHDAETGATRWTALRDGTGRGLDSAQGLALSRDGSVLFVGGQTFSAQTGLDYLLLAYDARSGDELWHATWDRARGGDRASALALAGDAVVLTGRSGSDADADIATVAFDTREEREGEILWAARYDGGGNLDEAFAMAADARRVVVAGESRTTTPFSPVVVAYDAVTGERSWVDRHDDPGLLGGTAFDVTISRDGRLVAATGYTRRGDAKGPTTTLYDASTGEPRWRAHLPDGVGQGVAISPDGRRVYTTGPTYTRRGTMHRTVSYLAATGAERWSGLYEQAAPPHGLLDTLLYPSGIALSPDGTHVYVGGATRGPLATHDDAMVLSYQA